MKNLLKDSNIVEKSKKLVWARFNTYTAGELRLLEVYLSRINPRDPESSEVKFTLSEYSEILNLPEIDSRNIQPQLRHFIESAVSIEEIRPDGKPRWAHFTLFARATCDIDPDLGQYVITISCNPILKDVFFNLAESGYVKYRLRYTMSMKSQYSIRLYSMLRDWQRSKNWTISIPDLRENLGAVEKSYSVFRDFRKRVLDVAVNEINERSDLQITYQTILKGRKATHIAFNIKLKPSKKTITARSEAAAAAKEDHDGAWYAAAVEGSIDDSAALKLAEAVRAGLHQKFKKIPLEKLDEATRDTIKSAYDILIKDRLDSINNVGGVLWSLLVTGKAYSDYLPAIYTHPEIYQ